MNGVAQIAALVGALAYLAAAPVCMSKLIAIAALSTAGAVTGLGGTADAAGAASATGTSKGSPPPTAARRTSRRRCIICRRAPSRAAPAPHRFARAGQEGAPLGRPLLRAVSTRPRRGEPC